jgi:hypothetical protein
MAAAAAAALAREEEPGYPDINLSAPAKAV